MPIKTQFSQLVILIISISFLHSCHEIPTYDLAIQDVKIFDPETKQVHENKSILIKNDTIAAIIDAGTKAEAKEIIYGNNRLACPGLIDTHIHISDIVGDYERAPEVLDKDSIPIYRNRLAKEYLAYGITTVKDAGHSENWLDVSLYWQNNPSPDFPNLYICGGAIISDEEREPYLGHVEVNNPEDAAKKVKEYYDLGIRYIKLYWRLREPEMKSIVAEANNLGMNICGHIDINIVSIHTALDLGVKHYEHCFTPFMSVFSYEKHRTDFREKYKRNFENESYWTSMLEVIRYVDSIPELQSELLNLLERMAENDATLCTTIHLFGSIVNRTTHKTLMQTRKGAEEKFDELTDKQLERLNEDFDLLMKYCKIVHEKGVKIRIGTDCKNGGKAVLSEMLLLYEAGFTVADILQISTLNGANAIDQGDKYGSVQPGKKADILIFEENPFEDYKNFLSPKIVIKDGQIFNN